MPNSTIDRLAELLADQAGRPWGTIDHILKQEYRAAARSILTALREPTEDMVRAAMSVGMLQAREGDATSFYPDDRGIWQAMVDAALERE